MIRLLGESRPLGYVLFLSLPTAGFLIGAIFGESGMSWIGRLFRSDHR